MQLPGFTRLKAPELVSANSAASEERGPGRFGGVHFLLGDLKRPRKKLSREGPPPALTF